ASARGAGARAGALLRAGHVSDGPRRAARLRRAHRRAPLPAMTEPDLHTRLVTLAETRFGKKVAIDDDFFAALGIDSMQALELLSEIEHAFEVEIPDWELAGVNTLRGLAAVVDRRRA